MAKTRRKTLLMFFHVRWNSSNVQNTEWEKHSKYSTSASTDLCSNLQSTSATQGGTIGYIQ